MRISGLQKLTLLDYPGRVACTVFTGGCNFRCPFCHNAPLVLPERLEGDENGAETVLAFLKKRQGILDGVAVTGGEPLLHKDIDVFLRQVKALGYAVKLDTNGSFPERLMALVEEGLVDRVAVDIKNSPALYAKTVGVPGFDLAPVERTKNYLLSGAVEYEFRTTVVKGLHTRESLLEAARWIEGAIRRCDRHRRSQRLHGRRNARPGGGGAAHRAHRPGQRRRLKIDREGESPCIRS